jgi:hypothetical protein
MPLTALRIFMCLVMTLSLLAPIAPVVASADAQGQQKQKLAREECVRNGGWWEPVTDDCEWGMAAVTKKASAYSAAKQACESKGGWFEPKLALCEFEAAAKVSYQASAYDQLQKACAQRGGWYDPTARICDTRIAK